MTRERLGRLTAALPTLCKAAVLSVGVPLTLYRLFAITAESGTAPRWQPSILSLQVVLGVAGLLWLKAVWLLAHDVREELRGSPSERGNWSSRWAGPLATLAMTLLVWNVPLHPRAQNPGSTASAERPAALRTPNGQRPLRPADRTPNSLGSTRCLADLALAHLGASERWTEISNAQMDRVQDSTSRFVDPTLLRTSWCLMPSTVQPSPSDRSPAASQIAGNRHRLEELAWLGLGVLGTASLVRRLRTLRGIARSDRGFAERLPDRDPELEALEARLEPFARATLIDWIEVANRSLRLVARRSGTFPQVQLVRAGPEGVSFYCATPFVGDASPFTPDAGGRTLTLPLTTSMTALTARCRDVGRLLPSLIPVGDDGQDCWLVAVGPGQQLAIDAATPTTEAVLRGITTALRTLPWAEELHIELMELAPPPASEHCYQMASSSAAVIADLAAAPPSPRAARATPAWRREPLIITAADASEGALIPAVLAVAGVIQAGESGSAVLDVDERGARLWPFGIELHVPQPDAEASSLIERLLSRAATMPTVVSFDPAATSITLEGRSGTTAEAPIRLRLTKRPPDVVGLAGDVAPSDLARVVEVLAYLHLHDGSATRKALGNALFPRAAAAEHRLDDVLAATRRAIDAPRSLRPREGLVSLPIALESDWAEVSRRALSVRFEPAEIALAALSDLVATSAAIEVAPFAWLDTEGHVARLHFELCDALHHLALLALRERAFDLAGLAIAEGLRLEPSSELLVRDLMLLRHETEGVAGVTASYEFLEASLAESGGREPNWTTRALYFELAGKSS